MDILNKEVNCTEIQFTEDGSWRAMRPDSDEYCVADSPSDKTTDNTAAASESTTGKFPKTFQFGLFKRNLSFVFVVCAMYIVHLILLYVHI